jgi:hypothetical protein
MALSSVIGKAGMSKLLAGMVRYRADPSGSPGTATLRERQSTEVVDKSVHKRRPHGGTIAGISTFCKLGKK